MNNSDDGISKLGMHDEIEFTTPSGVSVHVLRVPGGWIYTMTNQEYDGQLGVSGAKYEVLIKKTTSIFVPYKQVVT